MKAILILAFDVGGRNRFEERYAGMGVSELRRLKQLEDEKRRLRGLVADILQEVLRKKP
jgi:putative transposase